MLAPAEHLLARILQCLVGAICRHRRWFVYPQILLAGACAYYTVKNLQFDMSRNNLVGGDKKYHQNFLQFKKEFPLQDDMVVVVESEDTEKNRQFVERLGARLEQATNLFTDVVYKGDLKLLGPKALLFVPEKDLAELLKTLQSYRPFLQQFSRVNSLESLLDMMNRQFLTSKREASAENESMVKALPAVERILVQAVDSLKRGGNPPSPGVNAFFNGGEEAESKMYITYGEGRIYLVSARSLNDDTAGDSVQKLRELVLETQREVPGVNVGVTGESVLEVDEMAQSTSDTTLATVLSLVLVALIFIFGYNETGRPIKATFCLMVGLSYTMAFTTLVVGHLNILTVTFAPILIGLAIDFGVHLISRYEEELRHGKSEREALELALVNTGVGVVTGCLTTAAAFLAMMVTNFKGIQEMGIICGGGLLICLIPMMTLLPGLLLQGRQNVIDHNLGAKLDRRERIEQLWLGRPRLVSMITVSLCIAAAIPLHSVYFDYNLLNMQSDGLPAVVFEKKLIHSAKKSVLFGASVADSLSGAVELEKRFTNLASVAEVDLAGIENMSRYLTEDQSGKLAQVGKIKEETAHVQFSPPATGPVDVKELCRTLWIFHGYLTMAMGAVEQQDPALKKQLEEVREAASNLRSEAMAGDPAYVSKQLAAFQGALFADVRDTFVSMQSQNSDKHLTVDDLPPALRKRFVGRTGKFLVQVYPKKDVWQRENQKEFVEELRTVDPNVTGTPIQLFEYTTLLKNSYQEAAGYSLIAISIMIFLHFRSISCVVMALLPVAIGSLWMMGIMGLFGLPFNPANIMTLPLVIGVGVTNGIHILNRFAEERKPTILAKSTGKAVLVSGLTTIAGFGSLILAKHRGISSLGMIMSMGTATCMLAGLTFLPALLNLLGERGWTMKKPRGDNALSPAGSGGTEAKIPQSHEKNI